jgi:FKBP-type peptidyl-prolyl cis-trans isomerase SlpA
MTGPARVQPGSRVTLHLAIRLPDGEEALSTFAEDPVKLRIGDGTLEARIERAIEGLASGDRETLLLSPEQAYGPYDPSLIQTLARGEFEATGEPEAGQLIAFSLPNGDETAGVVLGVEGDRVEVDFNHPLAGHPITLDVEILAVDNG